MLLGNFWKNKFQTSISLVLFVAVAWQYHQSSSKLQLILVQLSVQNGLLENIRATHKSADRKYDSQWVKLERDSERMVVLEEAAFKVYLKQQVVTDVDSNFTKETEVRSYILEKIKSMVDLEMMTKPAGQPANFSIVANGVKNFTDRFVNLKTLPAEALRDYFVYYQPEVEYFNKLDQENPILSEHVRKNLWITPSPKHVPYVLKAPNLTDHTEGQLPAYMDVFGNKSIFYIECGGLDGEDYSNTLDLEKKYNWTGVLIEGSPANFDILMRRYRKSALVAACVSLEKKATLVKFNQDYHLAKIFNASSTPLNKNQVEVHCFPFYSIYKAIGREEIDLFILDVEGHEMEIMHTIPWEKVNILTLMVEYIHGKFKKDYMRDFMLKLNYRLYNGTKTRYWPGQNHFFIKKGSKYDQIHP